MTAGWAMLRGELRSRRRRLVPVLAWSALEALPALLSGWLVAMAADRGFLAGRPDVGAAWLGGFALAQLLRVAAVRGLLPRLADIVEPLRDAMVTRVVSGALRGALEGGGRPDTSAIARLTEQVQVIRGLIAALLLESRRIVISAVTAVIGLATLSPVLAGVALAPVVVCVGAYVVLQRRLRDRQHAVIVADETIASDSLAALDAARDVVSCGAQGRIESALGAAVDAQAGAERRLATTEAGRTVLIALAEGLPLVAVLAAAPWLVGSGAVGAGAVLGAVTYVLTGLQPAVSALLESLGGYGLQLGVTLDRIAATSSVPEQGRRGVVVPAGFTLDAHRLTHAHGPHAEPVVRELSLTIAQGEHLAVVGPSGIGKSTLVDLLTGVVAPRYGTVRLGGVPLSDVDVTHLRRVVALVPQEAYVVPGTLRANLCYLAPWAGDGELHRAVGALGIHHLLARTGGFDAPLADDLDLADRQLVVLARVYLSPARVVVLDEGTCHLDPVAEERVERAFRSRPGTLVVIAHRMSSARRADRVLVLDGRTAAAGTHEELMTASPLYRELTGHWAGSTVARRASAGVDACSGGGAFPLGPRRPELVAAAACPRPGVEAAFVAAQLSMVPPHRRDGMAVVATRSAAEALDAALTLCATATGRRGVVVAGAGEVPAMAGAAAVVLAPDWFDGTVPPARIAAARRLSAAARKACVPLVADETEAPGGRSGTWFASAAIGIEPDAIVVCRGLTGLDLPLAAVVHCRSLGAVPHPRPVPAAALAAATRLVELVRPGLSAAGVLDNAVARGAQISARLAGLTAHPGVERVRGGGLTWTVELAADCARQVQESTARHGVLVDRAGSAVHLLPPLDATAEQIEKVCAALLLAVEEAHLARPRWRPSPRQRALPDPNTACTSR